MILAALLCGGLAVITRAQSTTTPPIQSCKPAKDGYTCDLSAFRQVLAQAGTIAIQASSRDRIAQRQLAEMIASLGKTVAMDGSPADLTVQIAATDTAGVSYGPTGGELATLRVFSPAANGKAAKIFWVEIYSGSTDMPWPSVVHGVIAQFEKRLEKP